MEEKIPNGKADIRLTPASVPENAFIASPPLAAEQQMELVSEAFMPQPPMDAMHSVAPTSPVASSTRHEAVTDTDKTQATCEQPNENYTVPVSSDAAGNASAQPAGQTPASPKKPSKRDEYKKTLSNFTRIFSYSSRGDCVILNAAVVAAIGAGLTFPLLIIVFETITGIFNQSVLSIVYLFIGRLVLGYIATLGFRTASLRISSAMRLEYLKAILGQTVSLLDTQPSGQIASIVTTVTHTLQTGIGEKLSLLIQSISLIVSAVIISLIRSWKLTLVTSCGLFVITICYCVTIPFVLSNMKEIEESNVKASAVVSESLGAIRMVAACGAEEKMGMRYQHWVDESREKGMWLSKIMAVQQGTIFFSVYATFALSFWYATRMLLKSEITNVSTLIIVLMCVMMIVTAVGGIAAPFSAVARSAGAAGILFIGIDAPRPITTGLKDPDVSATGDIMLCNVNFTYPSRPTAKILDNVSFVIPAGKVTAIVGPSGSGKSTIVGLIERWYDLDGDMDKKMLILYFRNGFIQTGGKNLHELDLKWWRSQIGLVQQEPFLFNDTILNNVAFGLVGTDWERAPHDKKRELVEQACKEAFADEFISRLPEGYDTSVGNSGIKLSGGQRQRLAIARSIVKQPKILILDEATSSIDVRGEKMVQAALDKVAKNRTTIMIAHRLSTVKRADNIVVLQKGKVVQQGTHDSLMAQEGGAYWLLSNSQRLLMSEEADESSDLPDADVRGKDILVTHTEAKTEPSDSASAGSHETAYKPKGTFRSFGAMLVEQKPFWPWYTIMLVGALIAGASAPLQALMFAALISSYSYWGDYLVALTNFWCLMFLILAIAVGIGYFALGFASTRVAFLITTVYCAEYFQNILSKPIPFFDTENHSTGTLTALISTDPAQLQQLLGINMAFVTISVLNVIGCLTISFYFGWKLTLVAISSAMPLALAAGFFRIRCEKGFEKLTLEVFSESAKFATEAVDAIRTVTALTLEDSICARYEKLLRDHVSKALRRDRYTTLVFAASDSLPLLCMAFVLWYGSRLLVSGEYGTFNYLIVYIAVIQGAIGAGQWLSFGPNISQATVAANRIQETRVRDKDETSQTTLNDNVVHMEEKGVKIELHNVWFKYPTRDVPVLSDLNMTIEKGQFAAIVGPSGCGKTSIISLLERFYKLNSGQILFNGTDISTIPLQAHRKLISLVAQEPSLFEGSIRENILLGVDETTTLDSVLYQSCREAEIHDFIVSLPEGYDTKVGTKGVLLSGGQRQRISIARALIRNPKVLLLDEPTSNLDSETERLVQEVLLRNREDRTVVMVAHRLATVQNADVIFVLGDEGVLERGTHGELLQRSGLYYSMCQSQALDRQCPDLFEKGFGGEV
ncbi:ABC transporter-like protein [Pseudomassariella vexata]|uniref:ABC transporter-like protein n=1 Tax=Pseudomassariella vexata TaxID=1141098 RepID=A0A1Y2DX64_9PEZI|nr:ABC transporter-like protein [Pseudomassariella vexata]ORY63890.1 ABC transporter-like protein [Pseudomassariella vexata]